ncbi:PREDICTED: uncharacterized protein LOC105976446 [Erythranthe guttata]|uniref:uncharacterized protein LOC105976446 n=1 Tax=Erythranthe guttata TaxID=4155 RepID=UPI00064E0EE4|nr:PREDICTED: uncharacterized protein LOC105976446 [Erythranthe guttata]|eukprot:XP_012857162.1 PREDICTED: uncharacterized protein LOC105976446 [Erythranthe guttata]
MTRSRRESSSSSSPTADGFGTGTPVPSPQSQSFSRGYGSILPTSDRKRFLTTSGGAAYKESIVEETKASFRGSDECAAMIEEHALAVVYKPLLRACRKYLRDAGGISEEVIRGMEAGISDEDEDEVDVNGTGTELVNDMVADDSTVGTSSARGRGV